jgi:hypothetical protein
LPLGPRFAGSKPVKGDGFLEAIKIHSMPMFGGEVKPSAHVVRVYGMLKNSSEYEQRYFLRPNSFPSPVPPTLLLVDSAGGIARELWWTN